MPTTKQPTSSDARYPYKVFISSTYIDNEDRRKIVQDAITTAGMVWHGMEIFTASTRSTVEEWVRLAKEADVLVGIIAWRYGWEPKNQDQSITEMEYDAAKEMLTIKPRFGMRMTIVSGSCKPQFVALRLKPVHNDPFSLDTR